MLKMSLLSQVRWKAAWLAPVLLCGRLNAQIPAIEITSLPIYGSEGNLQGRASNIDPAAYHVATYLFLEGLGWYVKPTFAAPCTAIAPNGDFNVDVTTAGGRGDVFQLRPSSPELPHRAAVPDGGYADWR